jgi:hypothetical protein
MKRGIESNQGGLFCARCSVPAQIHVGFVDFVLPLDRNEVHQGLARLRRFDPDFGDLQRILHPE